MGSFETHLCIVSGQPIPNLAVALDSRVRPKRVVLLTSSEMAERARRLAAVCERHGLEAHVRGLADHLSLSRVREDVEASLSEFGKQGAVLNATGGHRPMTIAAYDVFRSRGLPVFYVNTDNTVTWLQPQDRGSFELEARLMLVDYLSAYGYQQTSRDAEAYRDDAVTSHLLSLVGTQDPALHALNWVAHNARERPGPVHLEGRHDSDSTVRGLFRFLSNHGVLEFDERGNAVRFPDEARRVFANGGWLEQHVAGILAAHRDEWSIADLASNLTVRSDTGNPPVRNGLDVAFLAGNHLHIVECKTGFLRSGDDDADELTQMLYKLDSVRKIGGLAARPMLVSWFPAKSWHRQRAELSDIRLVTGEMLPKLVEYLQIWVMTRPQAH